MTRPLEERIVEVLRPEEGGRFIEPIRITVAVERIARELAPIREVLLRHQPLPHSGDCKACGASGWPCSDYKLAVACGWVE